MDQHMYVLKTQRDLKLNVAQIAAVASTHETRFFFENSQQTTQYFGWQPLTSTTGSFDRVQAWFTQLTIEGDTEMAAILGGFPFEQEPSDETGALSNGFFFLPAVMVQRQADGRFCISVIQETAATAEQMLKETLHQLDTADVLLPAQYHMSTETAVAADAWAAGVQETVAEIKRDRTLKKVVLARQLRVTADRRFAPERVWLNARQQNPEAYHVLLKVNGTAFISNTPERLIKFDHDQFQTAAVAGTAPRGTTKEQDDQLATQLQRDDKNQREHRYVVDTIAATLRTQQAVVEYDTTPQILKNKNVQHLYTPITGTLASNWSPFTLLAALHPTPALGGVPRNQALRVIGQVEHEPRGLFGAPIGYLTFHQTGEFVVGIRSAVLRQASATLFAGAGIVSESVAETELAETQLKFKPMLQTLFGEDEK
ncbi:isochorismate synthase [Secundilactobacillus paracollinoides]|nr:isochorismate synthase [Secundilactobacillus paracollinoides]